MNYPPLNQSAPDFSLKNQREEIVTLSGLKGKNVVIYFYPKASTPGCTVQACGIRDSVDTFESLNTVVLGISPDPVKRIINFVDKQSLNFDLLSDEDHAVADSYGVWGLKKFMGREYDGTHRTTFCIDEAGTIAAIIRKPKVKDHANEVLAAFAGES